MDEGEKKKIEKRKEGRISAVDTRYIYIGLYMLPTIYKTFYPFSCTLGDGWVSIEGKSTWTGPNRNVDLLLYIYIFLLLYSVPSGYKRPS